MVEPRCDSRSGPELQEEDEAALLQVSGAGAKVEPHVAAKGAATQKEEEEALRLYRSLSFADGEECPTTYIYDIPEFWDLDVPLKKVTPQVARKALDELWSLYDSKCVGTGVHYLGEFNMAEIVLYRLLSSQRCQVTQDPQQADLFLVPYWPRARGSGGFYSERCLDPTPLLTHMDQQTAHKHLFILAEGHPLMSHCGDWWKSPTGLLRRTIRASYSIVARPKERSWPGDYGPFDSRNLTIGRLAQMSGDFESDDVPYPHSYSVPFPATGVLGDEPLYEPWKNSESKRSLLAYFIGGMHGKYGIEVRRKLVVDCEKVGTPTCLYEAPSPQTTCQSMSVKKDAYFCLEPGGDDPYRKSPYDDLSLGCIPVLFSPYMQLVAPWHWGHFNNASTVYINRFDYLEGRIDLFKVLGDIAASPRLKELRRSIAANGHAIQYSKRDYPGDGVERLLIGAHHAAQQREARLLKGKA